jgi:pilus assembly protein Flp/PilA
MDICQSGKFTLLKSFQSSFGRSDENGCVGCVVLLSFKKFVSDESGATVVEYGLIVTFVAIAVIGALQGLGGALVATFTLIGAAM